MIINQAQMQLQESTATYHNVKVDPGRASLWPSKETAGNGSSWTFNFRLNTVRPPLRSSSWLMQLCNLCNCSVCSHLDLPALQSTNPLKPFPLQMGKCNSVSRWGRRQILWFGLFRSLLCIPELNKRIRRIHIQWNCQACGTGREKTYEEVEKLEGQKGVGIK